ncbi:hypothetical protein [Pseudoalteromonas byunsanensis]|uniref:Uncharacterized protein n=1 Tax=Pseudoalteromonas byunsanensis TaxID=327939 RepID=A0A1S1N2F7_9GAMM|nr:hypothetical protein [Pseudoalteromonas byunsanensis]OHU93556.1 hypothetical protein BIW53_19640 [Pseudoalteromonas byunsanensis]
MFRTANLALIISLLALAVSFYGAFNRSSHYDEDVTMQHTQRNNGNTDQQILPQSQVINRLNAQLSELELRIDDLESRNGYAEHAMAGDEFERAVLSVIEQQQARERDEMRSKDPAYAFYESLPQDYEIKLKTDPDYAQQINRELNSKVLDSSLPALERLSAMGQLQMNMYVLNKTQMSDYSYEAVDAILKIAQQSSDEKLKVQALEVIANTPLTDARVADSFVAIVEREQNEYLRSMAADGLMLQYYQSKSKQPELNRRVAQQILSLYNHGDLKLKSLLKNHMFSDDMLDELNTLVGNG